MQTLEDIFLSDDLRSKLFTKQVPITLELWRFVRADSRRAFLLYPTLRERIVGKPPRQRTLKADVRLRRGTDGKLWVELNSGGVSTFGGPFSMKSSGSYYVLPKGTALPEGLAVFADEYSAFAGQVHYSIVPFRNMHLMEYLRLLSQLSRFLVKVR